jgi:histidinol-phosphatase (PHP family)
MRGVDNVALPVDNHVHSQWSYDASRRASMVKACAWAVSMGLPGVAFTEHLDTAEVAPADLAAQRGIEAGWTSAIRPLDVDGYFGCIQECRDRYPALKIFSGVEVGECHLFAATMRSVTSGRGFDRVLGSLHALPRDGRLMPVGSLLATEKPADVLRSYLVELLAMVHADVEFQVLAHTDFPLRYWPKGHGIYRAADFEPEYRELLHALADAGCVLEINTNTPLLSPEVVTWWREEGGDAVSFGSDAHLPWHVGGKFDLAVDIAMSAGFSAGGDPLDFWRSRPVFPVS